MPADQTPTAPRPSLDTFSAPRIEGQHPADRALDLVVLHLAALVESKDPGHLDPVTASHVQTALEAAADALPLQSPSMARALDAAALAAKHREYEPDLEALAAGGVPCWDEHLGMFVGR